jgi:hypothetical protein
MQRRILSAMDRDELGFAAFTGEDSRRLGFGVIPAKHGGIVIRCYGLPAYFLHHHRKLIEPTERNVPGVWYRMTDTGRAALAKVSGATAEGYWRGIRSGEAA